MKGLPAVCLHCGGRLLWMSHGEWRAWHADHGLLALKVRARMIRRVPSFGWWACSSCHSTGALVVTPQAAIPA